MFVEPDLHLIEEPIIHIIGVAPDKEIKFTRVKVPHLNKVRCKAQNAVVLILPDTIIHHHS
jgi:hypothetical protein